MYSIKMSGKTLKFDIVEFSKKEFHASELCISWKWFVMIHFFVHIKMSYYWFNRQGLLQKANYRYSCGGKEKAAKYYTYN